MAEAHNKNIHVKIGLEISQVIFAQNFIPREPTIKIKKTISHYVTLVATALFFTPCHCLRSHWTW